jgi:dihydroflavonol-4-reductase
MEGWSWPEHGRSEGHVEGGCGYDPASPIAAQPMTTVFVTGAGGFVGAHVVRELRAAGCRVRALSRRPEADAAIATLGAEPLRGDLDDETALRRAVDGCDAVFHLAGDTRLWAPYAARIAETNLGGTERLLRAAEAAGVGAFVHTSSTSAWSHRVEGVIDEAVPQAGATSSTPPISSARATAATGLG